MNKIIEALMNKIIEAILANLDYTYEKLRTFNECKYLATQEDRNGETVVPFCGHPCNPEDTEGNCRFDICPLRDNTEEHY